MAMHSDAQRGNRAGPFRADEREHEHDQEYEQKRERTPTPRTPKYQHRLRRRLGLGRGEEESPVCARGVERTVHSLLQSGLLRRILCAQFMEKKTRST